MNKKLIALALAGAFALPMAAQAETTLYGHFAFSYDQMNLGNSATVGNSRSTLTSNNSRFGIKGAEPIWGGINAIYQVESQFQADSGGQKLSGTGIQGALAGRDTFAGLNNKTWGTLWVGRRDTPYKRATGAFDPFADTIGDMNNIVNNTGGLNYGGQSIEGSSLAGFHQRLNRSIGYDGAWGGLYVDLQMGKSAQAASGTTTVGAIGSGDPDGGTGSNQSNPGYPNTVTWSGLIGYRVAGFDVNYSQERNKNASAVGIAALGTCGTGTGACFNATAKQIGVGYTLPAQYSGAKFGAVYEKLSSDAPLATAATASNDRKDWWIGASIPFLVNNSVGASYGKAKSTAIGAGLPNGAKQVAVGLNHNFTKNTSAYLVWARLANDTNGGYAIGTDHGESYAGTDATDKTIKGVSAGFVTNF